MTLITCISKIAGQKKGKCMLKVFPILEDSVYINVSLVLIVLAAG